MTTISVPAVQFKQGGRTMYSTVMEPRALVKLCEEPRVWNPIKKDGEIGTNRPLSKPHVQGIVAYMERTLPATNGEYVMDSVTVYGDPDDLEFKPFPGQSGSIQAGTLEIDLDAEFVIGNGQHRITAHELIAMLHGDPHDPVGAAHRRTGQPVMVVADLNPLHRAQDFVTLQKNVKSLAGSLSESMDQSQPINAFLIDLCYRDDIPILGKDGDRLEFDKDIISKFSPQLMAYKTFRYASGTATIGVGERTTTGWKKTVNEQFEADPKLRDELIAMWQGWGRLPGVADVLDGTLAPDVFRREYLTMTSAVMYACAYALHLLRHQDDIPLGDGVKRLASIDFRRPPAPSPDRTLTKKDSFFVGTMIDPATGKVGSGRPSWEAAGVEVYDAVK
jgi:DGQHR domain-containing protein